MKLTVLMENAPSGSFVHEHGLALHLSYEGKNYLLDTGSTGKFVENAAALHIDLAQVDACILSHGHYDHGNGLAAFFSRNKTAQVYLRPDAMNPQYFTAGPLKKFIGVDPQIFADYPQRFSPVEGVYLLAPGLWLVPDEVLHEQSLVAETEGGLVVLNSCCHAGAGNIVKGILAQFPGKKVRALVGGFHLMGLPGISTLGVSPGIVKNLACWLTDELGVQKIYTGHCTGIPAYDLLKAERPDQIHSLTIGDVL
ncbi:MAG: MBL fold metallo-hydrolase, partial [Oscillospiraceae bacterium]